MPTAKQLRKEIEDGLKELNRVAKDNPSYPGFAVSEAAKVNAKIAELSEFTTP
jgi:hypothetical protein